MSAPRESQAVTVARAHVEAWSNQDYDTARTGLAPDVHVTAITTMAFPPPGSPGRHRPITRSRGSQ